MRKLSLVLASLMAVAFTFATMPAKAGSHAVEACLITKTDINPFFVKMKEGAEARANELGVKLSFFAGKVDGDHETQVRAIETCIASGAKGILIAASDTKAIVTPLKNAQDNGLLVIALDTPLEPITAADSTFATDNFKAGELGGAWVAAKLGADAANAKIAMLDLNESQPSVGVLRDQGFLTGFGIDVKDVSRWGDEDDPRIITGAHFLRNYSLDELPQFYNVLKGEMSMVGPRPLFDEDTKYFDQNYMRRLNVLPGITGLLQINERNASEFSTWYKYDLEYIENWSLYLDLKIILKTPFSLFSSKAKGV